MGVIGISQGLSDAQNSVLSPFGSVGTDIIVTRTVAPTTSQATTTTTLPSFRGGGSFPTGGTFPAGGADTFTAGGGGFFARGVGGFNSTDSSRAATLPNNNSSIITDLAKLGKPGTQFTHDFFVPGTLITFPSVAISDVAKIPGVTSAVGALSLSALHESGTVKTGGQTISTTVEPPTLTAAQTAAERTCIQKILSKAFSSTGGGAPSFPTGGRTGTGTDTGSGSGFRNFIGGFTANPAIEACMTPAQKAYEQDVTVPEQTITRILNPPTTNTATSSYNVAGVDPTNETTGLITKAQLVSGTWLTSNSSHEVLVYTEYATTKDLKVGGTLTINSKGYKIVGLVSPTLTGNVADIYFPLSTMQSLASAPNYVNEVLVSVKSASEVAAVTKTTKAELPGATVLTSKTLADSVSGSLSNAHKLANDLGGVLAIVVLLAAFLIAGLLTLSSVAKRVREIGSLRAIGWTRGEVVRQVIAETVGIGIVGGLIGVAIGAGSLSGDSRLGPGLSVTSRGLAVGAFTLSSMVGQSTTATVTSIVHLTAPIHFTTILLTFTGALVGGLLAGIIGGWRAARLAPHQRCGISADG
jgi:ABC-type lipoprotein release transport system permease subunit